MVKFRLKIVKTLALLFFELLVLRRYAKREMAKPHSDPQLRETCAFYDSMRRDLLWMTLETLNPRLRREAPTCRVVI